ncbi:hypothetical protein EE612_057248 [Oryza sativa]|nr:hypothetical protein EE612_057248 [Oryza sativa]
MSSSSGGDGGGYNYSEDWVVNSRGMRLFTCAWIPKESSRGVVCLCHGYAVECSVTMRGTAERLARAGYAVHGIDYEGHGHSDGLQGYVPDLDALVRDCDSFFSTATASFPAADSSSASPWAAPSPFFSTACAPTSGPAPFSSPPCARSRRRCGRTRWWCAC